MKLHPALFAPLSLLAFLLVSGPARSNDWPGLLGPNRDGRATGETLLDGWPASGPELLFEHRAGEGYAGPAVAEGKVLLFHRVGDVERLEALSASDGAQIWQDDLAVDYDSRIDPDAGPRAVPLIGDGRVFTLGVAGRLRANELQSGKLLWTRDIARDFRAPEGYFGFGTSPILAGGVLLLNTGGELAGLAAFDPKTGETEWTLGQDASSYSSPIEARIDGQQAVVFVTRMSVIGVEPGTGRELFRFPFGKRGPTVNAASPVVVGGQLFVTASYGVGARLFEVAQGEVRTVWSGDDSLSSHYPTPVLYGNHLYGSHGREDLGQGTYRCVDARSGKVAWSRPDVGTAHTVLAGELALLVSSSAVVRLARLSPNGLTVLAETRVEADVLRAAPALANGVLYLKTSNRRGDGKLLALVVGSH